jgi:tetratricopeptide (TPR) repeat protein
MTRQPHPGDEGQPGVNGHQGLPRPPVVPLPQPPLRPPAAVGTTAEPDQYGGKTGPTLPFWNAPSGNGGSGPHAVAPGTPPRGTEDPRETLLETGRQLEARGDLHGAVTLYRQARQVMPPGDPATLALDRHIDEIEARIAARNIADWGAGSAYGDAQSDPRIARTLAPYRPPSRWLPLVLLGVLGLVVVVGAAILFLRGGVSLPAGGSAPVEAPRPTNTPFARLPGPGASGPPTFQIAQPTASRLARVAPLREAGDFDGALELLAGIKAVDPALPGLDDELYQTHMAYGKRLLERGEHQRSLDQYAEALKLRPDDAEATAGQRLVNLVRNRDRIEAEWDRNKDAALEAAEANFAIDPSYLDTREKLYALLVTRAEKLWEAGSKDQARATLDRAREIIPDRPEVEDRMVRWFATPTPLPTPTPRPIPTPVPPPPQPRPVQQSPAQQQPAQPQPQPQPQRTSSVPGQAPARVVTPLTTGR